MCMMVSVSVLRYPMLRGPKLVDSLLSILVSWEDHMVLSELYPIDQVVHHQW